MHSIEKKYASYDRLKDDEYIIIDKLVNDNTNLDMKRQFSPPNSSSVDQLAYNSNLRLVQTGN